MYSHQCAFLQLTHDFQCNTSNLSSKLTLQVLVFTDCILVWIAEINLYVSSRFSNFDCKKPARHHSHGHQHNPKFRTCSKHQKRWLEAFSHGLHESLQNLNGIAPFESFNSATHAKRFQCWEVECPVGRKWRFAIFCAAMLRIACYLLILLAATRAAAEIFIYAWHRRSNWFCKTKNSFLAYPNCLHCFPTLNILWPRA